uniref:Putative gamma-interferon inducible lysosomal thiol reductase n=1 Tax=Ixodes ricinus TaxID=34613 RepID=A0A6B0VAT0_IXORI
MKRRYGRFGKFTIFVALIFVCQGPFPIRCVYDGDPNIRGLQYNRTLNDSVEDDWFSKNLRNKLGKNSLSHEKKNENASNKNKEHKASEPVTAAITTKPPRKAPGESTDVTTTKNTKPPDPKKDYTKTTVKPKEPGNKGNRTVTVDIKIKKVELVVIYESLCPYSRRLVYSQLRPTYTQLAPYINLTLLPFGKAHVRTVPDGAGRNITKISCQHGESECVGNKIETCVLRVVKQTVTAVKIVACMSENSSPHRAGENCATAFGVQWSLIDTCFKEHGEEYVLQVAATTWKFKSDVTRVPIVVMNGKQGNYVDYHAQHDMIVIVCNEIRALGNEEPKVCQDERRQRRRRKR